MHTLELTDEKLGVLEHVCWIYANNVSNPVVKADKVESIRLQLVDLKQLAVEQSNQSEGE